MKNLKINLPIVSLWAIIILGLLLRLQYINRSFFYDELYIAVHGMQAPSLFDALLKNFSETNHLGYTAIAYPLCHLLGNKVWVIRLPALLFGLGSIFIFWFWVRKYFGEVIALMGALLLALSPADIIWSASARGYSACVFFTILSTGLYFSLLEKPSVKTAISLTLVNCLAPTFHLYFLCVFFAQIIHFLLIAARSCLDHKFPIKLNSLLAVFISLFATTFCILATLSLFPRLSGMAHDHRAFVPHFPQTTWNDLMSLPFWPLGLFCLLAMAVGFIYSKPKLFHWRFFIVCIFLTIFPIWLNNPVYLYPRFFAYFLPFFFVLMAAGMHQAFEITFKPLKILALLVMVVMIGWIAWYWCFAPSKIIADFHYKFRESVEFAEKAAAGNADLCAFGNEDDFFQYYAHRPIATFQNFQEFLDFYGKHQRIICMSMAELPMTEEHKKIFLFILMQHPKAKSFDNIIVVDLKD